MKTTIESRIEKLEKRAGIGEAIPELIIVNLIPPKEKEGAEYSECKALTEDSMDLCLQFEDFVKKGHSAGIFFRSCAGCKGV